MVWKLLKVSQLVYQVLIAESSLCQMMVQSGRCPSQWLSCALPSLVSKDPLSVMVGKMLTVNTVASLSNTHGDLRWSGAERKMFWRIAQWFVSPRTFPSPTYGWSSPQSWRAPCCRWGSSWSRGISSVRHQIIHFWMFLCRWKSKFKTESSLARLIALVVFHQVTRSDKFVLFGTEGVRVYKGLQTNINLGSYIRFK